MNKKNLVVTLICFIVFIACFFIAKKRENTTTTKEYVTVQGAVFGTIYHIIVEQPTDSNFQSIITSALDEIDGALSMFNDTSVISKINKGDSMTNGNKHFEHIFLESQRISQLTDGAFDITVAPIVNIWGFGFEASQQPDSVKVIELMQTVGYDKVSLVDHKIRKENPGTMLDASAIAKGYACDYVAEVLKKHGVTNLLVEIGGEVHAEGINSQNEPWKIGINKPVEDSTCRNHGIEGVVALQNFSLATSGNYRNFYIKDGKKYAHTINPKTGFLVEHNLLSATILASDCMTADAIATACMVMGLEKSLQFCRDNHIPGFFIIGDGDNFVCHHTEELEKYLQ
ncbi:MAG: FAD:protein FMN transferase [Bacteroidales bacterium]|nr:FAD:protein FMN transferase [Bacteroidales bacterium]